MRLFYTFILLFYTIVLGQNAAGQVTQTPQGTCLVSFTVDEAQSDIALSSNVVRPLPITFEMSNAEYVAQGVRGSLVAEIPGQCPQSGEELAGAVSTVMLSTGDGGSLEYYPSNVTFVATNFGTETQLIDFGFEASVDVSKMVMNAIVSSGYAFSKSILVPEGEDLTAVGLTSVSTSPVEVSYSGNEVVVNITRFNITLDAPYESEIRPEIDGLNVYKFSGHVVLRGVAGCDTSACLPNGRCSADEAGEAVCECGCGWSGPSCAVPSGFCSEFGGITLSGASSCPAQDTNVPLPPPPAESSTDACNSQFEIEDGNTGECVCKEGWEGPRCEACKTDGACSALFDAEAECGTSTVYSADTVLKSYTCSLEDTGLEDTIVPGTFYVTCNTTSPGEDGKLFDGSYCKVNFAMLEYPDNPITCQASLCAFKVNESAVNCETTSCSCERDCPDLDGIFANIQGRPALVDCDENNICTFDIENFFIKLIAPCETRECRVTGYKLLEGEFTISRSEWLDPFLSALPLLVLVSLNVLLLVFLIRHRSLYFPKYGFEDTAPNPSLGCAGVSCGEDGVLSFQALHVELGSRTLLHNVTGDAQVGRVTGLMGPSGSGKTTLISCLSQRQVSANISTSGSVSLDQVPLNAAHARMIAYCPQDSFLLPTLTVYETVLYSAILRLPANTTTEECHRVTQQTITRVGLNNVKESYVGGSERVRGISGGERKRVLVAMEIVTNPRIILLDEPTSGLDSSSAKILTLTLKSLASSGCIVMMSLHQPSPTIFHLLDNVFLLAEGHCIYNGPPGKVEQYLESLGLVRPEGEGLAEYMLECASNPDAASKMRSSPGMKRCSDDIEKNSDIVEKQLDQISGKMHAASPSLATELATLTWRNSLDLVRNPSLLILHWLLSLGMGIFAGCVFFQVGLDTSGAQDRAGGLIFALAFFAFTSLTTVDLVFHEKRIVNREVHSGYYRRWTYVLSKLLIDGLYLRFLPILLFSAPFYPMMGLQSGSYNVALYLMTLGTFAVTVGALSLAITFFSSSSGQASFIMNIILLVSLLNSGFFVNVEDMPAWVSWLRYVSVFFYSYSVLITNEVLSLLFNFVVEGYTAVENVRGVTFLQILGIDPFSSTHFIIILDCMYVLFVLLALVCSYISASTSSDFDPHCSHHTMRIDLIKVYFNCYIPLRKSRRILGVAIFHLSSIGTHPNNPYCSYLVVSLMAPVASTLWTGVSGALSQARGIESTSRRPIARLTKPSAISLSQTYLCGSDIAGSHDDVGRKREEHTVRVEGASCQWPRACEWPMRDDRSVSETAKNVLESAAAAASMAGATEWSREAPVYVPNDIDTDLPPDIELLALFSDSPIAWRPHETSDDEASSDEEEPNALGRLGNAVMKWWRRTWRYQGLGL
ncbi:hypothetical protein M9434_003844 [Picochlorum sp. BPE23]|nr:hypothetical protein M9434_003844 [Picochlorum sp. BPE23]